jgi:hypothetical protein
MPQDFRDVDPSELRLPSRRAADPFKLQRQVARFGASSAGMPRPSGVVLIGLGLTGLAGYTGMEASSRRSGLG